MTKPSMSIKAESLHYCYGCGREVTPLFDDHEYFCPYCESGDLSGTCDFCGVPDEISELVDGLCGRCREAEQFG